MRRAVGFSLRLGTSAAILAYLLTIVEWRSVASQLANARAGVTVLAPVVLLTGLFLASLRWRLVLAGVGVSITPLWAYAYYLIGNFYNAVLPGVIGGDVVRVGLCSARERLPLTLVGVATLAERTLGAVALVIVGVAFGAISTVRREWIPPLEGIAPRDVLAHRAGLVVVLAALLLAALWLGFREKSGLLAPLADAHARLRRLAPHLVLGVLFLSFLFQLADAVAARLLAAAIGLQISIVVLLAIHPLVYLATAMPVSIAGIGVREGVLVIVLSTLGVDPGTATFYSLLLYANRVVVSLIGGLVVLGEPWLASRNGGAFSN